MCHLKNTYLGRLKVKDTLEGQMIKWSIIELLWAISSVFKHAFQNKLAHLYSLKSRTAILNICTLCSPLPPPPPPPQKKIFLIWNLCQFGKKFTNIESSWQINQIGKKWAGYGGRCAWSGRVGGGGGWVGSGK